MCLEECSAHEAHLFKGDTLQRAVFMAVLQVLTSVIFIIIIMMIVGL